MNKLTGKVTDEDDLVLEKRITMNKNEVDLREFVAPLAESTRRKVLGENVAKVYKLGH